MNSTESDVEDLIVLEDQTPPFTRVMCALGAAVCLMAPYELLIKPSVPVLRWGMLPFWLISLGAMTVCTMLAIAAVFGFTRRMEFWGIRHELVIRWHGDFGVRVTRRYPFSDLSRVDAHETSDSDGPNYYTVTLYRPGKGRPIAVQNFAERAAAEELAKRVTRIIGRFS